MAKSMYVRTLSGHDDEALSAIDEISQIARGTWFSLLALLVFVSITLLGHQDEHFFAYGADTFLPLVNISVPTPRFFYAAPVLTAALYIYLHVYLIMLWDVLGATSARINDQPLGNRIFPWLVAKSAVWWRNRCRNDESAMPQAMGWLMVIVCFFITWLAGLFVLGWIWVLSWPAHDPIMSLWVAFWLWIATLVGWRGLTIAHRQMQAEDNHFRAHGRDWALTVVLLVAALLLPMWSWGKTNSGARLWKDIQYPITNAKSWLVGTATRPSDEDNASAAFSLVEPLPSRLDHASIGSCPSPVDGDASLVLVGLSCLPRLAAADLSEAELVQRPADWLDFAEWRKDYRYLYGERRGLPADAAWDAANEDAFQLELAARWRGYTRSLPSISLAERDLRRANITGGFLPGADLRSATVTQAVLKEARLSGVDFSNADMSHSNFEKAQMQGVTGIKAKFVNANLDYTQLDFADLQETDMTDASFLAANMFGANFSEAKMYYAKLSHAELRNANLSQAKLGGATLDYADLAGANLGGASLNEVSLKNANLAGARLGYAELINADLSGAILKNARLKNARIRVNTEYKAADFTCAHLDDSKIFNSMLQHSNFSNANLAGAQFYKSSFTSAGFFGANLSNANLSDGHFSHAFLDGADMYSADVGSMDLNGVSLVGVRARSVDFSATVNLGDVDLMFGDRGTKLPDGKKRPPEWDERRELDYFESKDVKDDEEYLAWRKSLPPLEGHCINDHDNAENLCCS